MPMCIKCLQGLSLPFVSKLLRKQLSRPTDSTYAGNLDWQGDGLVVLDIKGRVSLYLAASLRAALVGNAHWVVQLLGFGRR